MRVLAVGTVMVDVIAVGLPRLAEPGEVVYTDVETHIGGHPIDVAIDLVKVGEPAESVAVAAAIGTGPFADFVRSTIAAYGIPTFVQAVPDRDTGRNMVLGVGGHDRRLHLDPGANWVLDPNHVAAAIAEWDPDLLTLRAGYSGIDMALDQILAPLDDTIVLLDLMRPHPSRPPGYLDGALARSNIVHCNEREAMINTGAATADEAADRFLEQGAKLVLITAQEQGATAFTPNSRIRQRPFSVEAVDATGCGDAFCAGVIRFLGTDAVGGRLDLDRDELTELLLQAQAMGAAAATAAGCVDGVSAATVDGILTAQADSVRDATRDI